MRRAAALLGAAPLALQLGSPAASRSYPSAESRCEGKGSGSTAGSLRIVQYNVRRLTAENGTSLVEEVARCLQALSPTVVCLNEVDLSKQPQGLERIASAVGLRQRPPEPAAHPRGPGCAPRGRHGGIECVAYRYRHASHAARAVEEGQVEWPRGSGKSHRIRRGLLAARVSLPIPLAGPGTGADTDELAGGGGSQQQGLTILCTHLDHISEEQRVVQMRHILREMRALGDRPHLLLGDLNAICSEDYTEREWSALADKAAKHGWSFTGDGASVRLLLEEGYVDAFRAANPSMGSREGEAKFTAHVDAPMYRIDYAFISRQALDSGLALTAAAVDPSAMQGSDHFPLVVDLEWPGSTPGEKLARL